MDPFTEKLLERTRARRENLQKKMAERPNTANRQMVKRPRDPLGETNSVVSQSAIDKVPQVSTKPSPSKRKCSGENLLPAAGEENQEPTGIHPVAPRLSNPPTDKKRPLNPASGRPSSSSSSSQEKTSIQPSVQSDSITPSLSSSKEVQIETVSLITHKNKELEVEAPTSSGAGMRSRLQKLAEYRKCLDGDSSCEAAENCTPSPMLRKEAEAPLAVVPAVSSGTPVGRKGRLANLAATIGSWEDDLSHANIPKDSTKEKAAVAASVRFQAKDTPVSLTSKQNSGGNSSTAGIKSTINSNQAAKVFVTSSKVAPPSPQKANISGSKLTLQSSATPQMSSIQGTAFSSSPQKTGSSSCSSSSSVSQSPLEIKTPSRGPNFTCNPQKPELSAKPTPAYSSREKTIVHAPVVKSFLERFEERCHERTDQSSPAAVSSQARTPSGTPSVTPNTKLVQERLRATYAANTTTAELTQRQKLERESELALIRNRFQKDNNIWKGNNARSQGKFSPGSKMDKKVSDTQATMEQMDGPAESEIASHESKDKSVAPPDERVETPSKSASSGHGLVMSPPASTSSPLKTAALNAEACAAEVSVAREGTDVVAETEMSVDPSIVSAVINELFEGVLDQSEEEEEDEDALNISSMSLLTPLAETVAAVVKSPERGLMTSTPANSFIVKNSPDNVSRASNFHRSYMVQSASSGSVRASDDDLRLPYSIDAYRSTRVKETERPSVKQVIVRNEDVSQRAEEPRGSVLCSVKQKMKILKNEMSLQQTVIHQASQALNCCTDVEHGKGSQVEAEAERLLLLATEKREAVKAELSRLSGHLTAPEKLGAAASASKGSITVQELRLPLKADFVCSSANRPDSTKHSFFIIIRAGSVNTTATPLASTHSGLSGDTLTFSTKFTVSDVSSDFEIDIEIYCLVQKRDLSHEKKKKTNKSKAITPKRFLAITKNAQTPVVVASPGGPNAVRTSNFILVGSHKLTLSSIGKNKFPLEKVPFLCPLEGHIFLKLHCEMGSKLEERGFLTMFEDVSGFGAWHRRWCVLSGYCISYWTYPDDEKRKNPIGRINLATCTSKAVEPANREFCARPNTLELITARPQREDDKETLVSQCTNTMCVTKNWLSADTKDERNLWMKKLNQIVMDLRMWQPDSCYRPQ